MVASQFEDEPLQWFVRLGLWRDPIVGGCLFAETLEFTEQAGSQVVKVGSGGERDHGDQESVDRPSVRRDDKAAEVTTACFDDPEPFVAPQWPALVLRVDVVLPVRIR
jgi:hypothetical protein